MKLLNKLKSILSPSIIHGVIPAILLSLSVGQIYAFTLFSTQIANRLSCSQSSVQFTFSLGIFFLGMGAAFFGRIVERDLKLSTIIGTTLFILGLAVSHLAVILSSIWLLYIGYGLLVGLGTGIIYITPVKTMMLWFPNKKALASSIPIIGFGLGSSLCTVIHNMLSYCMTPDMMFSFLAMIYLIMMVIGSILLKKPINTNIVSDTSKEITDNKMSLIDIFTNKTFWLLWGWMLINISAGLALIPLAKQVLTSTNASISIISYTLIAMGFMNGFGRYIFAYISDKLRIREEILTYIGKVLIFSFPVFLFFRDTMLSIPALILVSTCCYGAGFSVIPSIVYKNFGVNNTSTVHGLVLSAWGIAGLIGNQIGLYLFEHVGYIGLIIVLYIVHIINFGVFATLICLNGIKKYACK